MHRFLLFILFTTGVVAVGVLWYPDATALYLHQVRRSLHEFWFKKQLSVRGLSRLKVEAVQDRLPRERATIWWILNSSKIEVALLQNPFIRGARLLPCEETPLYFSYLSYLTNWGCFIIELDERELRYIAPYHGEFILLGQDGSSLGAVSNEKLEESLELLATSNLRPKVLNGLVPENGSADVIRARFEYLIHIINTLEKQVALSVSRADLLENGEVTVHTREVPFEIRFDSTREDPQRLLDEVQRLARLLVEIHGKESEIQSVDLAFDKIAVVVPKSVPTLPEAATKSRVDAKLKDGKSQKSVTKSQPR